ncbi:hypothetical protein [Desulfocastanea catecholica]
MLKMRMNAVVLCLLAVMLGAVFSAGAQEMDDITVPAESGSLDMLGSIVKLKQNLQQRISEKKQAIAEITSETEKKQSGS